MKERTETEKNKKTEKPIEGRDYYFENELMVLTAYFLEKRGYCCQNGCRHCPYGYVPKSKQENF